MTLEIISTLGGDNTAKESIHETPSSNQPTLSKNQQRKLRKQQKYLDLKQKRRENRKLKKKLKKELRNSQEVSMSQRSGSKCRKCEQIQEPSGIRVCIDMDFEDKMFEKEVNSLSRQLMHCYAANRKAKYPLDFWVSSVDSTQSDQSQKNFTHQHLSDINYQNWNEEFIKFSSKSYLDLFGENQKIVYLTADSDNVIEELKQDEIYIVGGLVDRNRHKVCISLPYNFHSNLCNSRISAN